MIQTRLEKWERMSPSTVSISSRLNEATVRREMALAEITIRARLHCNEVNHTVTSLNNQKEQKVQALTENLDMMTSCLRIEAKHACCTCMAFRVSLSTCAFQGARARAYTHAPL